MLPNSSATPDDEFMIKFTPGEVRAIRELLDFAATEDGCKNNPAKSISRVYLEDKENGAQKLVDKIQQFPRFALAADGMPVLTGQKIWVGPPDNETYGEVYEATVKYVLKDRVVYTERVKGRIGVGAKLTWVYTTREAAEKAKASPPAGLTNEQLLAMAKKNPPPQSWYDSPEEDLFHVEDNNSDLPQSPEVPPGSAEGPAN